MLLNDVGLLVEYKISQSNSRESSGKPVINMVTEHLPSQILCLLQRVILSALSFFALQTLPFLGMYLALNYCGKQSSPINMNIGTDNSINRGQQNVPSERFYSLTQGISLASRDGEILATVGPSPRGQLTTVALPTHHNPSNWAHMYIV